MKKFKFGKFLLIVMITIGMILPLGSPLSAAINNAKVGGDGLVYLTEKPTFEDRQKAAEARSGVSLANVAAVNYVTDPATGYLVPDYFGSANWAFSPQLRKFIDELPGFGPTNMNLLGQYIPVAVPDKNTYPGSDYYEIAIIEYREQMHSDLPITGTKLRGYVQLSTSVVPGNQVALTQIDGVTPILKADGSPAIAVDGPHYLGPAILSDSDRPVRIKFYNLLPTGTDGDLFIPVDTSVMGSGMGPMGMNEEPAQDYKQNRANIHLHGNNTVWISDGTPHQWITPAGESTLYPQGVSVVDVPDMNPASVSSETDGVTTLYYTNAQSARLMFYHDHSYGITRLNVYAGAAAPYIIQDQVEKDLIAGTNESGVNPLGEKILPDVGMPLVIQDKTFVDETTVLTTDPTWTWGTNPYTPGTPYVPTRGDLWYPHVYSPAQNPWDITGTNVFGRWMYGPWFYPPTSTISYQPIANPYYDPLNPSLRPSMMPSTPNPSTPGESYMDTPIVNGTAYPFVNVDPTAVRFRILNAANDRFFNLQLYVADPNGYVIPGTAFGTEVKMIPATASSSLPSNRPQIIPDPAMKGPDWIQIGTEGGFLPAPAVIPSQPISWNLNQTNFNVGNIDRHSLLLGSAERADVIVDFSQYAGQTLILYNDAPAPFPANDPRYDYYTGDEDLTSQGGAPSTQPGHGPNIRTIMQIRVADITPSATYDIDSLNAVFAKTAAKHGVFETSQAPIIIPQAAYNSAYNVSNLPADAASAFIQLFETSKTFQPINAEGILQPAVTLPLQPKAMHDEMGGVYDDYGRMSGYLGLTSPNQSSVNAPFIAYGYASPPVEIFQGTAADMSAAQIGTLADGTQIWKITHNGVDTHTIHTHLFDAQLINRVAWDGIMLPQDANELGWKETFRVNPLEHTYIAMRPKIPTAAQVPFDVPNSERLIDPTMPEGAVLIPPPPVGWVDPQGINIAQILNHKVNFGWEYVYHCHILSHEEMDMMHTVVFAVPPKAPSSLVAAETGTGAGKQVNLLWTDNSISETGFTVQRSDFINGPWTTLATLPPGTVTYTDPIGNVNNVYFYRAFATNTVGDTQTAGFPTKTVDSAATVAASGEQTIPTAPTGLTVVLQQGPQALLSWTDNSVDENGFVVERADNGGSFLAIDNALRSDGTGTVTYTDSTILSGNSYSYRIAAVNTAAGQSAYTNTAGVTVVTTAIPVISVPVYNGSTSVSGTAEAGASVVLSLNGTAKPAVTATGGNWTVNGLTLSTGNAISVTAVTAGKLISTPAATVVLAMTTATPVINAPVNSAASSVSGTAEVGASVILRINGTPQPSVTATGGSWTVSGLTLNPGNTITVTAQTPAKLVSAPATTVITSSLTTARPVILGPIYNGTYVNGTAEVGANIILSINNIAQPAVTATGGNWTVSGLTLLTGETISVTAQAPGKLVSFAATMNVDPIPPVNAFITRLYQIVLGRDPDPVGLAGWVGALVSGQSTAADIVYGFVFSPEFQSRNLSNADYVTILYRAHFNREPDTVGFSGWMSTLDNGMSRYYVLAGFVNSVEFNALTSSFGILRGTLILTQPADLYPQITSFVTRFYKLCLNRMPDAGGLNDWVANLKSGKLSGANVAYGFVFSQEFQSRNVSNADYVTIMYHAFFSREPDLGGYNGWLNVLNTGGSRYQVLTGFTNSIEFSGVCQTYGIIRGTLN